MGGMSTTVSDQFLNNKTFEAHVLVHITHCGRHYSGPIIGTGRSPPLINMLLLIVLILPYYEMVSMIVITSSAQAVYPSKIVTTKY